MLTGCLCSDDAFVSIFRGLFNTRDRAEHTRKRKIVSHSFSQRSVAEFEPYIISTFGILLKKWDALSEKQSGKAWIQLLDWMNALAFDVIGDLAFGSTFGMLERDAADVGTLVITSKAVLNV